jgi:crossover junction endodeoxyribonuclease RusA
MCVEIEFPVEVMVPGTPLSLQASPRGREDWKSRIREAAQKELPDGHFLAEGPMKVVIYVFTDAAVNFDIDNIVKPICDSLNRFVYLDDRQVERLVVQKFEPGRLFTFASPSPKLAETIDAAGPRVYLLIDVSAAGELQ